MLDHNPYRCDCELFPVLRVLPGFTTKPLTLGEAACSSPPSLAGVKLLELDVERLHCDVPCAGCRCHGVPATSRLHLQCDTVPEVWPELPGGLRTAELELLRPPPGAVDLTRAPPYLRHANLSSLNLTGYPAVRHAMEIDLRHNLLRGAPLGLFAANCSVLLADNPLGCECGDAEHVAAFGEHAALVADLADVTCADGAALGGVRAGALCAARRAAAAGGALALLGLAVAGGAALLRRYRPELRLLLRKLGLPVRGDAARGAERYDAFVSFAHEDEALVAERLVPALEGGRAPLRLCVHYRDWVVGDWIPAQIARSVQQSRRTIVVVSRHFVQSQWGRMELRAALARRRVVLLLVDNAALADPELAQYAALNTYVRLDDPLVWERLRDAVLLAEPSPRAPSRLLANMLGIHRKSQPARVSGEKN
ncbi:protein toll-like [Leptidea sinapis]|uniref:protein toll-like n=1 Tax=Leptidea sinapis TaxID=189913 RepID=UPI0021C3D469|nr:protein toll-like [Leptidea sinapis]